MAVIVQLPAATPVTKPVVLLTVAIVTSVVDHETLSPGMTAPNWSFTTAVIESVWLVVTLAGLGVTVMVVATLAAVTVPAAVPEALPAVAVIVALPAATPVTRPLALTLAVPEAEDDHETV
jgi:hypothetical protein